MFADLLQGNTCIFTSFPFFDCIIDPNAVSSFLVYPIIAFSFSLSIIRLTAVFFPPVFIVSIEIEQHYALSSFFVLCLLELDSSSVFSVFPPFFFSFPNSRTITVAPNYLSFLFFSLPNRIVIIDSGCGVYRALESINLALAGKTLAVIGSKVKQTPQDTGGSCSRHPTPGDTNPKGRVRRLKNNGQRMRREYYSFHRREH